MLSTNSQFILLGWTLFSSVLWRLCSIGGFGITSLGYRNLMTPASRARDCKSTFSISTKADQARRFQAALTALPLCLRALNLLVLVRDRAKPPAAHPGLQRGSAHRTRAARIRRVFPRSLPRA